MPITTESLTQDEIADSIGVPFYRVQYIIKRDRLRGSFNNDGRRVYTPADVDRIRNAIAKIDAAKSAD